MKQILIEKYIEPSEVIIDGNYIFKRWLDRNYNLHSFMGQPACIFYKNGQIIKKIWCKKGVYHRERDLPAIIEYDSNGQITYQSWFKEDKLHRHVDLPAVIYHNHKGQIIRQRWYKNGKLIKTSNQ
jgi:hypothetical protein